MYACWRVDVVGSMKRRRISQKRAPVGDLNGLINAYSDRSEQIGMQMAVQDFQTMEVSTPCGNQ